MSASFEVPVDIPFLSLTEWDDIRNQVGYDMWCYEEEGQAMEINDVYTLKDANGDDMLQRRNTITSKSNPVPYALRPLIGYENVSFEVNQHWWVSHNDKGRCMSNRCLLTRTLPCLAALLHIASSSVVWYARARIVPRACCAQYKAT